MPPYVSQASIAIEDQEFYQHFGFSIQGITRAFKNTLFKNKLQGGSTITQQLVKVALLTPKVRERP
ncbi:transglycosylase domain-containing protein [Pseudomonadota bacterium]